MLITIEKYRQLPPNKMLEAKGFVYDCNRINGFESQLYWECIQARNNDLPCDFLYYHKNKLIALTSIYYFNAQEVEVDILIHPSMQEEYEALFNYIYIDLLLELQKQPISSLMFRFHRLNIHLKSCVKNLGATYKSSDYVLSLKAAAVYSSNKIEYRLATIKDIESIFTLQNQCFATVPNMYRNRIEGNLCDNRRKTYLFYDQTKQNLIGKLHVRNDEHRAVIHDFCVLPSEQHKKYGSEILKVMLPVIFTNFGKQISLEIENQNEHLMKFYHKFHFEYACVFDYWQLQHFKKTASVIVD